VQINTSLNLVFPIRKAADDTAILWAYHVPIDEAIFQSNFRIISLTHADLFGNGPVYAGGSGRRIAADALREHGKAEAKRTGEEDKAPALLAEISRLTTILAPGPNGFQYLPANVAISQGIITAREWKEAEYNLVFFTCAYAMADLSKQESFGAALASVLGGSIQSLSPTEYAAYLQTLTQTETSEAIDPSSPQS
jgi:hypothetical protein